MDSSLNVPDTSDWLQTHLSQLAPVEQALRCQVCKDFFDTPMITSCSHTFCSLCIRRCLTNDGRCPTCRTQDQEMRLRPNSILQELVDAFQTARPAVFQLSQEVKATRDGVGRGQKRELDYTDIDEGEELEKVTVGRRRTRFQRQSRSASHGLSNDKVIDDEEDGEFETNDGLSACPICGARMKEEVVFSHLDVHNKPSQVSRAQAESARNLPSLNVVSRSRQPPQAMERLPQLNYSLLKDNALRKKLSELGVPNGGPRAILIRRHTEWVNLVNANCDSRRPRPKRELLRELDLWDKTQGRQILNSSHGGDGSSTVMNKDFDSAAWAVRHDSDFQNLIAMARSKAKPKTEITSGIDQFNTPVPDPSSDNRSLPDHSISACEYINGPRRLLSKGLDDN